MRKSFYFLAFIALSGLGWAVRPAAPVNEDTKELQMARGKAHYVQNCLMCHQAGGQGAAPVYPPLARSDWLMADRQRAIKVLCEGLAGPIVVNGQTFNNAMPAQMLDDSQVADVLTYATNSWGNKARPFTPGEVRGARRRSRFKTFATLTRATAYQPLPQPPPGWKVREVAKLAEFSTRMTGDGTGKIVYVLSQGGKVSSLDVASGALLPVLKVADFIDSSRGDFSTLGFTLGQDGRLWLVTNQLLTGNVPFYTNEVVVWQSTASADGHPRKLRPWFKTSYPQGSGPFNHGVTHMAFGPDGMLYINSGARTDNGIPTRRAHYAPVGETDATACIWRLDPNAENPQLEIFARGLRNAFGFAWDDAANLFAVSNGPDADPPEEMECVERGRHYGFPYQFSNWPVKPNFPYRETPPVPAGLQLSLPVVNLGPDAGGSPERPLATFEPHSSPAGMIWCGPRFPELVRNSFLITRFGNLMNTQGCPVDVGFDVISARMEKRADGSWATRVNRLLAPLGRPVDIHAIGGGAVLILEYTRPTNYKDKLGWMPGRIIELAPAPLDKQAAVLSN